MTSIAELADYNLGAQTGTTSLTAIRDVVKPANEPAVFEDTNAAKQALLNGQVDAILADLPTALYITAVEIPKSTIVGQFQPETGKQEEFGLLFEKGSELVPCVNAALGGAAATAAPSTSSSRSGCPTRRASPCSSERRLGAQRPASSSAGRYAVGSSWSPSRSPLGDRAGLRRGVRGSLSSPGWPRVHETFFNGFHARESFEAILHGFWINVKLFLICEPLILVLGLAVALARTARAPWLLPLRLVAVGYTDLFRGIPTILLVVLFAFGMPALRLQGVPNSALFWAGVALVVSYGAYVAEVFRSGIDSIHPSQVHSASALGLSRGQTMRHVVVPQAVRRVIPPLLNDFVSLQKDTALVAAAGVFDAVFAARDYGNFNFNYTPLVVVAGFFVVMTVPLARVCDWLQRRWMERERAGAL